jgi:hypothetical protein
MSDKILCGSFIRSESGFEYSHMDDGWQDGLFVANSVHRRDEARDKMKKIWSPSTIKRKKTESILY